VSTIGAHRQSAYDVRLEWGAAGAAALAADTDLAVVVDVLSFTTTLTVAAGRGISVLPYRWTDDGAAEFAREHGAALAVGRREALRDGRSDPSLSPASMARPEVDVERLVLPSPNGATICALLAESGTRVVGACLRNASAVAGWLAPQVRAGACVAVLAAGEQWPDGSLRPAAEDLWGAGSVLAGLPAAGLSPEAELGRAAFVAVRGRLSEQLHACASGRELVGAGFAEDVRIAAELDADQVVPVLDGVAFTAA
jgi:2-phosphosulfolactate phosphatase